MRVTPLGGLGVVPAMADIPGYTDDDVSAPWGAADNSLRVAFGHLEASSFFVARHDATACTSVVSFASCAMFRQGLACAL